MAAPVNVTGNPSQTGLFEAEIEIPTGNNGLTIIVIVSLVAGLLDEHCSLEVKMLIT